MPTTPAAPDTEPARRTFNKLVDNPVVEDYSLRYGLDAANPHGNPIFKPGPVEPHYSSYLMFEGICVEDGRNYYMDATVAYRRACLTPSSTSSARSATPASRPTCSSVQRRSRDASEASWTSRTAPSRSGSPLEIFDRDILPR